jgi:membrane associated rhomboid family serine protease
MIFFPTHTDRKLKSTPWVNYTLIAINVVVFILTANQVQLVSQYFAVVNFVQGASTAPVQEPWLLSYYLQPGTGGVLQYFSYQFLHAGWMHLIGNMLFLFVFGNAVEDRLGKVGYLFFYLAVGVIAGLGHSAIESNPVLGASGSVAGVTGAYLALFPLSNVTIVYWWIVPGSFEVSSMLLILFQVAQNVLFQLGGVAGTAYLAHLAGYTGGFVFGMGLLMLRVLPREPYDMLSLIERRRRKAQFNRLSKQGYQPWEHNKPGDPPKVGKEGAPVVTEQEKRVMQARTAISAALVDHDMPKAAELYADLLQNEPEQVMGQQQQLDIANQLMSEGQYEVSASAYQLFLVTYKNYPDRQQVQLILGLIFARYLDQRQRAKELLAQAVPRLHGEELALAKQVLEEIG